MTGLMPGISNSPQRKSAKRRHEQVAGNHPVVRGLTQTYRGHLCPTHVQPTLPAKCNRSGASIRQILETH
jgi:hypothetical protein